METGAKVQQSEINPIRTLLDMAGAYAVPRSLHTVADLGVADALGEDPETAEELAEKVSANPDALGRVLRLLCEWSVCPAE